MYWPLGAPKTYAQPLSIGLGTTTDDGLPLSIQDEGTATSVDRAGSNQSSAVTIEDEAPVHRHVRSGSRDIAQPHARQENHEGFPKALKNTSDNGVVIGMRVARSGHLFATITRSALTVWQTKVREVQHSR